MLLGNVGVGLCLVTTRGTVVGMLVSLVRLVSKLDTQRLDKPVSIEIGVQMTCVVVQSGLFLRDRIDIDIGVVFGRDTPCQITGVHFGQHALIDTLQDVLDCNPSVIKRVVVVVFRDVAQPHGWIFLVM